MAFCNLCGCSEFLDHKNRRLIRCKCCGSLDGHRLFGLLALDLLSRRHGRTTPASVTVLSEHAESSRLVRQIAPSLFVMRPAADLIGAGGFDILLLDKGVATFSLAPAELLAAWRRGISHDGIIAFPVGLGGREEKKADSTAPTMLRKAPDQLAGDEGLEWLQRLPGWRIRIWNPHEHFEPEAVGEMALRYRPSVNPIVLASPAPKLKTAID